MFPDIHRLRGATANGPFPSVVSPDEPYRPDRAVTARPLPPANEGDEGPLAPGKGAALGPPLPSRWQKPFTPDGSPVSGPAESVVPAEPTEYGQVSACVDDIGLTVGERESALQQHIEARVLPSFRKQVRVLGPDRALQLAGWHGLIWPLLRVSNSPHKVSQEEQERLFSASCETGLDIVFYQALATSRAHSPDTVVAGALEEMVRNLSARSRVAAHYGVDVRFVVVDELSSWPEDEVLGFTTDERARSQAFVARSLQENQAVSRVIARNIGAGIVLPSRDHRAETAWQLPPRIRQINENLRMGVANLDTYRARTFLEMMTPEAKAAWDITDESSLDAASLDRIHPEALEYVVTASARFGVAMDARSAARSEVESGRLRGYPEYWDPVRTTMQAGVTRSPSRPTIAPVGRWRGTTVNILHGIPVYDGNTNECLGIARTNHALEVMAGHPDEFKGFKLDDKLIALQRLAPLS